MAQLSPTGDYITHRNNVTLVRDTFYASSQLKQQQQHVLRGGVKQKLIMLPEILGQPVAHVRGLSHLPTPGLAIQHQ